MQLPNDTLPKPTGVGPDTGTSYSLPVFVDEHRGFISVRYAVGSLMGPDLSRLPYSQPTTLRNLRIDRVPSGYDLRHTVKINGVYQLPVGPGRHFSSSAGNVLVRNALQGWQIAGVTALQSGILHGFVGQAEYIIARIAAEIGGKPKVVATGGLADLVAAHTKAIDRVDERLVLDGLYHWATTDAIAGVDAPAESIGSAKGPAG